MRSYHHGGLAIHIRRKMMRPLLLEPRLHPSIVKFFALIRLHAERPPRRSLLVNTFQSTYHVWTAFGLDGDRPGILGQDIDHGQQIFVALIPSTEFLHVHQIHLPLFVTVKEQGRGGRKTRSSGFVERIAQHRESVALAGFSISGLWQTARPHPRPQVHGDPRKRAATT